MKLKNIRSNFTMVPNQWFKSGLSLKAVGLISLLQSLPDEWEMTISGIASLTKNSKSSIQSAMNELKEAGLIKMEQVKDENGRFSHNIVRLFVKKGSKVDDGKPVDAKSVIGKTDTINIIYNKENNNKKINNINLSKDKLIGETPKSEYGKAEINELFDKWEKSFGYKPRNTQANRFAAYNLLRNKQIGGIKLEGIIRILPKLQNEEYCTGPIRNTVDFVSLQRNWDYVWNAALSEWRKRQNISSPEERRI